MSEIHLLDLDGTLIDSNEFVYERQAECLNTIFNIPKDELISRIKSEGINSLLSDLGMTSEDFYSQEYEPWDPTEMARTGRLDYFKDAKEYLDNSVALKFVVTNSSQEMTNKKTLALGINDYVDGIYSAQRKFESKPNTDMGEKVLNLLMKNYVLKDNPDMNIVGDFEVDILFGLNMKELYPNTTILIDRDGSYDGKTKPDRIIKSMTELL